MGKDLMMALVGQTVKRMADEAIRQGHFSIQDASDFFKWGINSTMKGVQFVYVSKAETMEKHTMMQKIKAKPLKGTMKLHAIRTSTDEHKVMTKETSCYCAVCLAGEYCELWIKQTFDYTLETHMDSIQNDDGCTDKPQQKMDSQERNDTTTSQGIQNTEEKMKPKKGCFVAAVYDQKWYIGQVVDIEKDEDEVEVNFMTHAKNLYRWPQQHDRIWIDIENILCEISPPVPSGKSKRLFKIPVEDKEHIDGLYTKLKDSSY